MEATLFYEQLVEEEKSLTKKIAKLNADLNAVKVLRKSYGEELNGHAKEKAETTKDWPTKYDKELNQDQKAYIALFNLSEATAKDVAKQLTILDAEEFTPKRAEKVAREKLSKLAKEKVIGARKLPRANKNLYFIK